MTNRIRVLHICDKFGVKGSSVHGVSRLFTWWLPRFDASRFDVRLVGLRKGDPAVDTLRRAGIDVVNLERSRLDPRAWGDLARLVRWTGANVLHLHGYAATNFGRLAGARTGAKIVVHEHFVDPAMPRYQRVCDRVLRRHTHAAVAVSESVRRFMIEQRSIPAKLVRVVYNGAPLEDFRPDPTLDVAAERARLGVPAGVPALVTIGRLDEQKGIAYLLEAMKTVLAARDARLVIVGDGPLRDDLEARARALGIADAVVFAGYRPDVQRVQTVADLQVFPSLWEGTPLTVFEAMAMGRAIVSTDVDGLGEVLEDGRNALVVAPRDPRALATAILDLLADPARARALAHAAAADSRRYGIDGTVRALEEIYERLCAPSANGSVRAAPRAPVHA